VTRIGVVAGPAPGHAFPAAALATALTGRGAEVLVLTGSDWLPRLAGTGIAADLLPALRADPRDVDFGFRLYGRAAEMAPGVAGRLRAFRPDAVVGDTLTVAARLAAGLLDVPFVELIPHPLADPPGRLLRRLQQASVAAGAAQRLAAARAVGLADAPFPALRLVATLPGFERARADWPAGTAVVGPLEWEPAEVDLLPPAGDGPLVFVSESTAETGAGGLLDAALELPADVRVVGSTLGRRVCTPRARLGPGRQAPLLAACRAVVCGAGHGILMKALVRGRPVVCVPGGGEQGDNARRVVRLGCGLMLPPHRLTPARLAAAVQRVLADDRYRQAAGRLAATGWGMGPGYAAGQVLAAVNRSAGAR
jgi:UDP:flavonoid glycosyltransferase YjiC (YdhE family)